MARLIFGLIVECQRVPNGSRELATARAVLHSKRCPLVFFSAKSGNGAGGQSVAALHLPSIIASIWM
jgi:hypothetical protein